MLSVNAHYNLVKLVIYFLSPQNVNQFCWRFFKFILCSVWIKWKLWERTI